MGAQLTEQVAAGKTPNEAYNRAVADAASYYGTHDGYSGAINSKATGYVLVDLPPRMTYAKLQALLEESEYVGADQIRSLRDDIAWRKGILDRNECKRSDRPAIRAAMKRDEQAIKRLQRETAKHEAKVAASGLWNFDRLAETYNDKWDVPLCVEIKGAEAKRYTSETKRRGERLFLFFGYAPC